jgi:predicted Zn-dependent protease with MMP-like domain
MEAFGKIVRKVMETLPDPIRSRLDNVTVEVLEEPTREMLEMLDFTPEEIEEGESIYGLFSPMELSSMWAGDFLDLEDLPQTIYIFKLPLEEDFPERKQLLIEIRKTVIHEVAHHFHLSDRDLAQFDDTDDPFQDSLNEELEREADAEER